MVAGHTNAQGGKMYLAGKGLAAQWKLQQKYTSSVNNSSATEVQKCTSSVNRIVISSIVACVLTTIGGFRRDEH
jgi:hypothetical protein